VSALCGKYRDTDRSALFVDTALHRLTYTRFICLAIMDMQEQSAQLARKLFDEFTPLSGRRYNIAEAALSSRFATVVLTREHKGIAAFSAEFLVDEARRKSLRCRSRSQDDAVIEKKLHAFAPGSEMALMPEAFLAHLSVSEKAVHAFRTERLARCGVFLNCESVKSMPGQKGACHDNSHALALQNPAIEFVGTGYALSKDGVWRQHSWVHGADGRIVETTESRIAYFGTVCDCASCLFVERCKQSFGATVKSDDEVKELSHGTLQTDGVDHKPEPREQG